MLWLVTIATVARHLSVVLAVPPISALLGFLRTTELFSFTCY